MINMRKNCRKVKMVSKGQSKKCIKDVKMIRVKNKLVRIQLIIHQIVRGSVSKPMTGLAAY